MSDQRYLVTARKYRPTLFTELVAQEHVTETLKNAIRLDRLAHAYLFSGPRGVGKTTAARILAKAINCTTPQAEREDQAEPCRTCDSCLSFEEGRNLSIFEIDAASNNKVEDIRDLRETVRIPPQGSRKKVYIIDEVHMLSNAAFNALLKTLEEPPPHVLFIFATTEPHKVLPTILSRCQRFDFRRIPVPDIVARLEDICTEESITADEASLMLVARKGDGALRDALSAFDQAVALCGTDLQYTDLAEALRVVDVDLFFAVTQQVLDRSSAGMLRLVAEVVQAGYDLQEFLAGLAEHLRNLLVARTMEDTALIEAAEATRQRYGTVASGFSESDLLRLLMIVDEAQESIKSSTQPRMKLEMALLKMASLAHAADLRTALQQLDRLEKLAREGKLPAAAPEPSLPPEADYTAKPSTATIREPETPNPATPPSSAPEPQPSEPAVSAAVEDTSEPTDVAPEPGSKKPADPPEAVPVASPAKQEPTPDPAPATTPSTLAPSLFGTPALQKTPRRTETDDTEAKALLADVGTHQVQTLTQVAVADDPVLAQIEALWPRYVQAVKTDRIHVGSLLQHTAPLHVASQTLTIGVPDAFHRRLLSSQHAFLLKHLVDMMSEPITTLTFTIQENLDDSTPKTVKQDLDPHAYMQKKRQENPVIQAIFEQFGGELVW